MRYYLRNQEKISNHYSPEFYQRLIDALDHHFKIHMIPRTEKWEGVEYDVLMISDLGHTVNDFVFYVLRTEGDLYRLAFIETIG